ncbi:MAG TPA: hypothetical protein VH333_08935 [Pseudonocardiaceae bacterium]|nr:hypothetical protein [Pseudonocardiaceae bacterium]
MISRAMISSSPVRRVGVTALLVALGATGAVALAAPASADTVGVSLTVSPTTVTVGDSVTVTETITNTNGFTILQPKVQLHSTPDNLAAITTLSSCDPGPGGTCATLADGYQATLGAAIGGGASVTVSFTLAVDPTAASAVETLVGQLAATNFNSGPVAGPTLTINALADLGVTLTGKPNPGLLSMTLDFTVKVTNSGQGTLQHATYTATATSGLDVRGSGTCTAGHNSTATCAFGTLAAGASANATFAVPIGLLDIGIPFQFGVTRTTSSPTDPNAANDSSTTTCTVVSVLLASCGGQGSQSLKHLPVSTRITAHSKNVPDVVQRHGR